MPELRDPPLSYVQEQNRLQDTNFFLTKFNADSVLCIPVNKMDLKEILKGGMHWIDLAQDSDQWWALGNTVINHRKSKKKVKLSP
jgi:hypothetical protein